jgi:hypothetical protein
MDINPIHRIAGMEITGFNDDILYIERPEAIAFWGALY